MILLLFGPGSIARTAGELGKGMRAFRDGLTGKDERAEQPHEEPPPRGADGA